MTLYISCDIIYIKGWITRIMRKISSDDIREFRIQNNLSQQDLAEMLGVSWVSVHRWETGKSKPSKLCLKHLNNLMGKSLSNPAVQPEKLYLNLQEARQKLNRISSLRYDAAKDSFYRIKAHSLNLEGDLSANPDDFIYGRQAS